MHKTVEAGFRISPMPNLQMDSLTTSGGFEFYDILLHIVEETILSQ